VIVVASRQMTRSVGFQRFQTVRLKGIALENTFLRWLDRT